jgi:hypothetical protein
MLMPTVYIERGFSFRIYAKDHPPPHVHVFRGGNEVVIKLLADGEVGLRESGDAPAAVVRRALGIAQRNWWVLMEEWNRIHGKGTERS